MIKLIIGVGISCSVLFATVVKVDPSVLLFVVIVERVTVVEEIEEGTLLLVWITIELLWIVVLLLLLCGIWDMMMVLDRSIHCCWDPW